MKSSEPTEGGVRFNEHAACSLCGRFGAFEIGHQLLCPACYECCGSCCPEFGRQDLEARVAEETEE